MKRIMLIIAAAIAAIAAWGDDSAFARGTSAAGRLDLRTGTRIATEGAAIPITYSPRWGNAASCTVDLGGSRPVATSEGETTWTPQGVGGHTLTHTAGDLTYTAQFAVLGDDVALHAGTLGTSETWGTNKTHLVTAAVTVPSGEALMIERGAVVKFMAGASLTVASGGSCTARGVVFTHVSDDTIGGDTLMDGDSAVAKMGDYTITGSITDDDSTEYRYLPPQTLTSNISSNTRLRGYRTYIASNSVTVASGATLTLQPGTVIKFNTGCSLTVNGTLDAQGTRAAPIVFTSLKDDEHGGDTNGDGDWTRPIGGDWRYIYVSGMANLKYCKALYGAPSNETGIIETTGSGSLVMDSCIVAHALYDGIWNWGGSISVKNTIITDTGWASAPYRGTKNEYVNCVFYGNNVGMCYWSNWNGSTLYRNCIFAECAKGWCELGSNSYGDPSSRVNVSNCLFWNPVGFSAQSCGIVGSNGNIWGDPKFVDAENGDFRIQKGSPCINAGDAANAPEFDYYGQPRDDGAPDIGIYEFTGGMSANDLAAVTISRTGSLPVQGGEGNAQAARSTIGDTLTVSYDVANVGKQAINGSWRDKVSLVSADGGYSIDLGTVVQTAALAVGATNTFNASFTVPTDAEGTWRVQVGVNVERDIYEGANVTNNVATSAGAVEISLPARAAADGFSGTAKKGAPASAKFALDGTEPMVARINAPAGTVVYLGSGFMPSASSYSARAVVGADGGLIGIPAGVTSAYILVETTSSKGAAFTMTLESAALAVQSVTPTTLPYTGTTGLVIDGANFAEGCTVVVERAASAFGTGEPPVLLSTVVSPTRITAQIDCSRLTAGATYDVKVIGADEATATLPNAVTVANIPAAPKLKATLDAPASVRRGRTLTVYIDYENTGNADMPAPVFELISQGQVFKIDGAVYTNSVKVMGLSSEAPVGTLRPGEPQRLAIPVTILAENVKWKLKSYHAAQEGAKKKLQLEALMGGDWVRDIANADAKLYAAVCERAGTRWSAFYSNLGACLDANLDEAAGTLLFDDAVELFMGQTYDAAKESLDEKDGETSVQTTAPLRSTATLSRMLLSSSPGELTGTKHDNDNSRDGDVWWYRGAKWLSVTNESVKATLSGHLGNVFLICHGNANSIHEEWIENMAAAAIGAGYSAALAVDWGDGSCSHLALNPEKNSVYIPAAAKEAVRQLKVAGVTGGNLTVCGHSHGGHLGGIIAKGMGAKRLIGMDTSPIWTHKNTPVADRYPQAWNGGAANSVEFYKTSWDYSMGTDPADVKNGDIFGSPSFFVTQTGDFYKDAYKFGDEKHAKYGRALELHGFSHQWTRMHLGTIAEWNWKASSGAWKTISGYDGAYPCGSGCFSGVFRGVELECGTAVKTQVAENMGASVDSIEWLYDRFVLGKDLASHASGLPAAKSAATSIPVLQDRWLKISEHGLNSFAMSGANSSGVYELGSDGIEITMFIENYANNLSVDYNHSTVSRIEKPWQRGFGHLILIADVTDADGTIASVVNDVKASGGASRLSWNKIMQLQNAGLRFAGVNVEGGGMMNEDVFLRPVSGSKRNDYYLPLPASVFPAGKTDDEEPRDAIVLGIVGVNANSWRKSGKIELYEGELCPDNNCIARLIKVKPKGPSGEVMSGTALHFEWSYTQVSAFAPENIQDDNTWTADENGNWTVTLTGAASYGPTNIVAGSWTGFDCTVSQREWTPDPNVTVTGHLFTGEDGDFVPAQNYTVILAVEDANGKIGTKEYTFTIKRHVDEDDGEDEDDDSSNEPKSCDPNEMVGDEGVGEQRFVKPGQELTYTIYFENKSDADAAAACVEVLNPLSDALDWSSLVMLDVGYNNNVDNGLSGLHEGWSEKALEGTNTTVKTEFAVVYYDEEGSVLDENALAARSTMEGVSARAEWYLRIIDPNGDSEGWPLDMTGGFLPPNDPETHCGEGYIRYKVKVRDDAPANTIITNSATIIFDHFNDPIETDPAWWNTVGSPGAQFAADEVVVDEGGTAEVRVSGGSADKASSVKVYLTYNTAAAADVDLKTGTVADGDAAVSSKPPYQTNLKFPLVLTWAKGEMGEKVITIPVKTDKTVEDDEFFTLQLAEAVSMELGEERVCTVTIRDMNDKTLKTTVTPYKPKKDETVATNSVSVVSGDAKGGFVAGTGEYTSGSKLTLTAEARPGWAFQGWRLKDGDETILSDKAKWQVVVTNDEEYVAVFEKIPYVRGLADPADGGKVSGSGLCAAGKKVTLKATASKNFTFLGWVAGASETRPYQEGEFVAKTPSLVIDRSAKPAANSKTSTTITNVAEDVTYYAVFKSYPEVFVTVEATDGKGSEPTGKGAGKYVAGTITGMGKYAIGKTKIALKATANKGYVFSGWYDAVGKLLTKDATYTIAAMGEGDVEYTAKFITSGEDKAAIQFAVDGVELRRVEDSAPYRTNVWTGVYLEWPVASSALSATTVKVTGLPPGLKFTAKPVTSKVGTGKAAVVVTNVPANTVYGAPTAASKADRNGKVTSSKVVFTVTTAGKSSQTYQIDMVVEALPAWASGKFNGGSSSGQAQLTVAANGKLSGKYMEGGVAYTLAAGSYSSYADGSYFADVTASWSYKDGKATVKASDVWTLAVGEGAVGGVVESDRFDAWQNLWSQKEWKDLGTQFFGKSGTTMTLSGEAYGLGEGESVTLSIKANGTVTAKGVFGKVNASGSAVVCAESAEPFRGKVFVYFAPNPSKGFAGYVRVVGIGNPN